MTHTFRVPTPHGPALEVYCNVCKDDVDCYPDTIVVGEWFKFEYVCPKCGERFIVVCEEIGDKYAEYANG